MILLTAKYVGDILWIVNIILPNHIDNLHLSEFVTWFVYLTFLDAKYTVSKYEFSWDKTVPYRSVLKF